MALEVAFCNFKATEFALQGWRKTASFPPSLWNGVFQCVCFPVYYTVSHIWFWRSHSFFRERWKGGRKRRREIPIGCLLPAPNLAGNADMCPDGESDQRHYSSQAGAQPTELHRPQPVSHISVALYFLNKNIWVKGHVHLAQTRNVCTCVCKSHWYIGKVETAFNSEKQETSFSRTLYSVNSLLNGWNYVCVWRGRCWGKGNCCVFSNYLKASSYFSLVT